MGRLTVNKGNGSGEGLGKAGRLVGTAVGMGSGVCGDWSVGEMEILKLDKGLVVAG